MSQSVSRRQSDLLFVLAQNGGLCPSDLPYHLPGYRSVGAYRSACARLERRGLLAARYTGIGDRRERMYEVTDEGLKAIG